MRYVGVETLSTIHCCTKNRILKGLQLYNLEGRSKVVGNDTVRQAMHHFLLVICSNNVSIVPRFQYLTTFAVYRTAYELESLSLSIRDEHGTGSPRAGQSSGGPQF